MKNLSTSIDSPGTPNRLFHRFDPPDPFTLRTPGKQMMPNMISGPLADVFDADAKDAWLTHGVNKFVSGAFAVN